MESLWCVCWVLKGVKTFTRVFDDFAKADACYRKQLNRQGMVSEVHIWGLF